MTITLTAMAADLREHIGDDASVDRTDAQLQNAIRRAIRISFDWFFKQVIDETTFVGAGTLARNTSSIAVPAAFYNNGIGRITQILARMNDGTVNPTPSPSPAYFPLDHGIAIDDLSATSPKIRFTYGMGAPVEIMIYGIRPLAVPTNPGDTIEGSDWPGYIAFLLEAAEKYARAPLIRSAQYDTEAQTQRMVIAQQDFMDIAKRNRMQPVAETLFRRW